MKKRGKRRTIVAVAVAVAVARELAWSAGHSPAPTETPVPEPCTIPPSRSLRLFVRLAETTDTNPAGGALPTGAPPGEPDLEPWEVELY
jgi:hypothetical protein